MLNRLLHSGASPCQFWQPSSLPRLKIAATHSAVVAEWFATCPDSVLRSNVQICTFAVLINSFKVLAPALTLVNNPFQYRLQTNYNGSTCKWLAVNSFGSTCLYCMHIESLLLSLFQSNWFVRICRRSLPSDCCNNWPVSSSPRHT